MIYLYLTLICLLNYIFLIAFNFSCIAHTMCFHVKSACIKLRQATLERRCNFVPYLYIKVDACRCLGEMGAMFMLQGSLLYVQMRLI